MLMHPEEPETTIAPIDLPINLAERLESVKAGLLGAVTGGLTFGALTLVKGWWLSSRWLPSNTLPTAMMTVLMSGAIAALSGFLFGITYRYIIRQDQNSHLKDGAVLAFGLVRGLALVEGRLYEPISLPALVIVGIESLLLFAGIRLVLDKALAAGWLKPFGLLCAPATTSLVERQPSSSYSAKSSNSS
ncbi:MAG: hypothetical protein KME27_13435 [Lyngbya sp. HA4199-MV5]|jgi:hypothetical protein|nr:hypothetical protein [Lyngbya sp. HA4199-MV5]